MDRLIYYPGFEVKDSNWLKFALLYFGKLEPIIPPSGNIFLSSLFTKISNETDLIKIHNPEYQEGERATLDAIDAVEKIIRHPQAFSRIFHDSNLIEKWRNKDSHTYLLFEEKFTDYWARFCIDNNFASRDN